MLATIARKLLFFRPRPQIAPDLPLRAELAKRFLRGKGIEIGGLNAPLPVPAMARVTHVDRMSAEELRRQYPELDDKPLAPVDVIDDGEWLTTFPNRSQDFVIANHFLEHAEDPIGTLKTFARVLKTGGILYLGIPNRRLTFDRDRQPTSFEHVRLDHFEGPARSYEEHLREWASLVDCFQGDELEARIDFLRRTRYSIHYHVWNEVEFREFVDRAIDEFALPLRVEFFGDTYADILCIARKTAE
jgi:SAM-dependent methyltransferase